MPLRGCEAAERTSAEIPVLTGNAKRPRIIVTPLKLVKSSGVWVPEFP